MKEGSDTYDCRDIGKYTLPLRRSFISSYMMHPDPYELEMNIHLFSGKLSKSKVKAINSFFKHRELTNQNIIELINLIDPTTMKTTKTKKTGLPYELFIDKSGHWKWRKRARNGRILNHEYNSKAGAIKGMKADYDATLRMGKFDYKEV